MRYYTSDCNKWLPAIASKASQLHGQDKDKSEG